LKASNLSRTTAITKKSSKYQTRLRASGKITSRGSKSRANAPDNSPVQSSQQDANWLQDIIVLRRAAEERVRRSRQYALTPSVDDQSFRDIAHLLDDESSETRQWAVKKLYELNADLAATLINDALRDGSPAERRNIGLALADSGLLFEAIEDLSGENHERCYGAFSLLLLVAKAGVVEPLISVIKKHPSMDVRLAVIRLLASSTEREAISPLETLAKSRSLEPEIRSATLKAIRQITGQAA